MKIDGALDRQEREYAFWMAGTGFIGPIKAKKLLAAAGSYRGIYNMKKQVRDSLPFLTDAEKEGLEQARQDLDLRRKEYEELESRGIRFILPEDSAYPERLKPLFDRPGWLFVRGTLPRDDMPSAAVVGARSCTDYGRQEAEYLGRLLAENGIQVVSGLACGIDGAAHRGAVRYLQEEPGLAVRKEESAVRESATRESTMREPAVRTEQESAKDSIGKRQSGRPFAVLGSGIDVCYPQFNRRLFDSLPSLGGLISEYGPGVPPKAWHFPVRNRLISGLSDAVIVVEARARSGSLITADLALEQGREVMAFPGRRTDPLSVGCNQLIRQGAALVSGAEDILDFFQIKSKILLKEKKKMINTLAKTEKMVYSCLDSNPKHLEEIMRLCGLSAGGCAAALLNLELDGLICQPSNQYYTRKLE